MKNKTLKISLLLIVVGLIYSFSVMLNIKNNLPNSGKINYELIIYEENKEEQKYSIDYQYKQNLSCTEFKKEDFRAKVVNNLNDTIAHFFINIGGMDVALKTKWNLSSNIEMKEEYKNIKGYKCRKAIVKTNFEDFKEIEVWFDENSNSQGGIYGGITGLDHIILEMKIINNDEVIVCKFLSFNEKYDNNVFDVSTKDVIISADLTKIKDLFTDFNVDLENNKE